MKPLDKDLGCLQHIVDYCDQIEKTMDYFGRSYELLKDSQIYRNAVALCILQIGELVKGLSDEFKANYPGVPWKQIRAMRNIVAHHYGTVDTDTTWEVITEDIPELKSYCLDIMN